MKRTLIRWGGLAMAILGLGGMPAATNAATDPAGSAAALQNTFSDVAAKAIPAVVVITNKQIERQGPMYPNLPPELQFFFGIPRQPQPLQPPRNVRQLPKPVGKGSGIIIRPNGYIVTNYHVIKGADALEVRLRDGRVFDNAQDKKQVRIVGVDKETDLAVLQIGNGKLEHLPYLQFADSSKVRVGDWAIAVGAPFNLDYSVSVGVVSQKGRYDLQMNTYENYIQTDASINPGNSGGPLLNIYGKVIGINDFIVTGGPASRGSVGLGFAIDSDLARQVTDSIIAHGRVVRPWLGIAMQTLTDALKKQFGVKTGVLVSEVMSGDPADKAGVKAGDVILKVGDKTVRTPHDVQFAVLAYKPGDKIRLLINRGGKIKTIAIKARERKESEETASIHSQDDLLNKLGLALQAGDRGVVVTGVVQGSPADFAQIQRGDLILQVNRRRVKTVDDVLAALGKSHNGMAVFYIERRGTKFFVAVPMAAKSH